MSAWHHLYEFWVGQQTLPGNILSDVAIGGATYLFGKYKVGPWLRERHEEHLKQSQRQHDEHLQQTQRQHEELIQAHRDLLKLHERHHKELLEAQTTAITSAIANQGSDGSAASAGPATTPEQPADPEVASSA